MQLNLVYLFRFSVYAHFWPIYLCRMIQRKMNIKISCLFLLLTLNGFAQVSDSASNAGGKQDVYYKLSNGSKQSAPSSQWDFAFTNVLVDASVLSNDAAGVQVYLASEDITKWNSLDTTGTNWNRIYNSEKSWGSGAFSNLGGMHPDYGWGQYNQSTHNVIAKRLFFVKLKDGSWRKMMIEKMETNGNVSFKLANLDGSNVKTGSYNKITNKAFNFTFYDAVKDSFLQHEAPSANWDLSFSKYYSEVAPGSLYLVSGVRANMNVKVAQREGIAVNSNDTNGLVYGTNISEIGSDWKTYDQNLNVYKMATDRTYFVKLKNGEVWKLFFTGYVGGPSATSYFSKELIAGSASAESLGLASLCVYPNPANGQFTLLTDILDQQGTYCIQILDQKGSIVRKIEGVQGGFRELTIQTAEFKAGMYVIELRNGNQVSRTKLFIQ